MPEAALSGTIPHRPPNARATAEMPVRQDIQCEMIQSEQSLKKKKVLHRYTEANHRNASIYTYARTHARTRTHNRIRVDRL